MTAAPVEWVLDELGAVVDAQPAAHPLRRVDRDNSLVYDDWGDFDMNRAMEDLEKALEVAPEDWPLRPRVEQMVQEITG